MFLIGKEETAHTVRAGRHGIRFSVVSDILFRPLADCRCENVIKVRETLFLFGKNLTKYCRKQKNVIFLALQLLYFIYRHLAEHRQDAKKK